MRMSRKILLEKHLAAFFRVLTFQDLLYLGWLGLNELCRLTITEVMFVSGEGTQSAHVLSASPMTAYPSIGAMRWEKDPFAWLDGFNETGVRSHAVLTSTLSTHNVTWHQHWACTMLPDINIEHAQCYLTSTLSTHNVTWHQHWARTMLPDINIEHAQCYLTSTLSMHNVTFCMCRLPRQCFSSTEWCLNCCSLF